MMTDSFHGTVISLLYHRPFVVYIGDPNRITRIVSLLTQLGLEDRILTQSNSTEDIRQKVMEPIDWEIVDLRLDTLRRNSYELLRNSLMS